VAGRLLDVLLAGEETGEKGVVGSGLAAAEEGEGGQAGADMGGEGGVVLESPGQVHFGGVDEVLALGVEVGECADGVVEAGEELEVGGGVGAEDGYVRLAGGHGQEAVRGIGR